MNALPVAGHPALPGLDVWERAYCLTHQNRRPECTVAFYKLIDRVESGRRDAAVRG